MKPVSCRLGRHKWNTVIEHGEEFRVCEECGKENDGDRATQPISTATNLTGDMYTNRK